ncbi:MAG TPA: Rrf2 family transcriptional regulator [Flavisolibacter sp.]|nr:Rrf2 family transcriptional regulator [Flavisolibacter sp.]
MIFSKSFGYAVRSVLYIVLMQEKKRYVQAEEIAETLVVPRHFVSKILKKLVKAGVLHSSKGKTGGFASNEKTSGFLLFQLYEITDGNDTLKKCALRLQDCHAANPCPLHVQMDEIKQKLKTILSVTTIGNLVNYDKDDFVRSLATLPGKATQRAKFIATKR